MRQGSDLINSRGYDEPSADVSVGAADKRRIANALEASAHAVAGNRQRQPLGGQG
jgi:hypothetical protein